MPTTKPAVRQLLPLLAVALSLAACSPATDPVTIAVAGPLSDLRGRAMRQGAELARDEINARGGVRGRPIELRFADDSADPDVAARVAQRIADDPHVLAVVGHLTSSASVVAGQIYGAGPDPVVMLAPATSSADLSALTPWAFRLCPTDSSYGTSLARFARHALGARRAAIIFLATEYGRGIRTAFATDFARLGGTVVEADPYVPELASVEPYLQRMRRAGIDVLLLATEQGGAELALRQIRTVGLRAPVLGGDALAGLEEQGTLAEGLHVSTAYLPDEPSELNAAFVAAYARTFPAQRPDARAAGAYDAVTVLADAMASAGPSRASIRRYLSDLGQRLPAVAGVMGPIAFDSAGNSPARRVVIGTVRGGRLVLETGP
ncbi:MAG TPA: ABC transporter substrate-binding protein [Gemmatimonadales bacterium]|nr:ABC transporter substrate-binding protein [Gemmatimonadales bacterium]